MSCSSVMESAVAASVERDRFISTTMESSRVDVDEDD